MVEEGSAFPEFSLPDQDGTTVSTAGLAGKRFVVFCYSKDGTPG